MYYSYSYYSMKPKQNMMRSSYVSSTGSYTYSDWQNKLEDSSWRNWPKLSKKFAEDFQFALLQGITVIGIECSDWDSLFDDVNNEYSPFQGLGNLYLQGQLQADWRFFAKKVALETYKSIHYPVVCPEWLFPYGYSQQQYLQDLTVYWDNLHDDYYQPWETTRIGEDSPEIARLKRLGQAARQEISEVAQHSAQYVHPSNYSDGYSAPVWVDAYAINADFGIAVENLCASFEWLYLTEQYPAETEAWLLALLERLQS